MKRIITLAWLIFALHATAFGGATDDFTLFLSLTIGERSRDSNAETTTLELKGSTLVYEQTYSGFRASSRKAVRREFKLKGSEISHLKDLIKEQNLLGSGSLKFEPTSGQHAYFELNINLTLKGIIATQDLSGPRAVASIKSERVYQKSVALLQELYRLINLRDKKLDYQAPVN